MGRVLTLNKSVAKILQTARRRLRRRSMWRGLGGGDGHTGLTDLGGFAPSENLYLNSDEHPPEKI